jgi:hypothetical protein
MTSYVVLLPGDESMWAAAPEAQKQEMYALHAEFAKLLADRGQSGHRRRRARAEQ